MYGRLGGRAQPHVVVEARLFGPNVELRRTIRSALGVPAIHIRDEFVNRGNTRVPHAWLLHINLGYPLLEPGASTFCYRGKITPLEGVSAKWFAEGKAFREVPPSQESHRGNGEVVACSFVAAFEPMAGTVDGRDKDRQRGLLRFLEPGQTAVYSYSITATNRQPELDQLLAINP